MPVYRVTFTVNVFRANPDGTQMKVERLLTHQEVVAGDKELAVAVASRYIPREVDDELLGNAKVAVSNV